MIVWKITLRVKRKGVLGTLGLTRKVHFIEAAPGMPEDQAVGRAIIAAVTLGLDVVGVVGAESGA